MDESIRQQALDPCGSFIVEAPAGSGKTELLVQRVLSLLAFSVRYPEEILAITFTRKAAHEMRSRIINALEKSLNNSQETMQSVTRALAQKVLARDKKENWQLLANPNRLCIQTIDALCMRLTKQMPILSGMGGDAHLCNNPDEIYKKSVKVILATLDEATPWQKALITIFKHFDNQYENIESVFIDMLKKRDQWLTYVSQVDDYHALQQHFEQHLANITHEALLKVAHCFSKDIVEKLLPLAQYAGHDLKDWPKPELAALPQWLSLVELLLTKEGEYRKQVDKRIGFPANVKNDHKKNMQELLITLQDYDELRLALVLLREAPPLHYTENSWEFLQALLTVLPIMAAQLMVMFAQQGQVDFTEVSTRALHALGEAENPTDLALVLDYQLQHILVDEFQDTSITQFRLLEKMIYTWQPGDGHTLFLVGDPMQSIYRFRQANVGLFLKAKYQGIGEIELTPLQLCMNFRSLPVLIHWINQVMPKVMPKTPDIALGAVPFTPCQAAKAHDAVGLFKCLWAQDALSEAQLLVTQLQKVKQAHPNWQIAILVRARSHLHDILPLLQKQGIAYQALEIEPLAKRAVIHDLLALTRALLHVYDRVAWLSLLRAPFCGLDLAQIELLATFDKERVLWDVMQDQAALALLSTQGRARLARLTAALAPTLAARDRMPLAAWVNSAWIALAGASYTRPIEEKEVEAFYQLLTFLEQEYGLVDSHRITAHLEKLYTDQTTSDVHAVQVMTIHKAKGLEFDAVFLPGLARRPAANTPPVLRYTEQTLDSGTHWLLAPIHAKTAQHDLIYQYLGRLEKHQHEYEMQRLLYVALTRAKQQLYLLAVVDPAHPAPAPQSLLALIANHLNYESSEQTPGSQPIVQSVQGERVLKRIPLDWQLPQPWHDWLYQHEVCVPVENTVDTTVYEPDALMRKHVGTLLHRILKYIADKGGVTWDDTFIRNKLHSRWRIQLLELGVVSGEINSALLLLTQAIEGILNDPRGQWILQAHDEALCEYPLHTRYRDKYTRIVIDRTFIFQGERWIIDYKSGQQDEMDTYIMQLQQYAAIMQHIDKRPIRLGLYFPLTRTWKEVVCNN